MIAKEAKKLQILEIEKLSRLAIGKRILNLQLKKKNDGHIAKLKKKEKIQLFFRDNRIKRYDYDTLIEEKFIKNTLIATPYQNGKLPLIWQALLKQILNGAGPQRRNRMFYHNYSGSIKSNCLVDAILRLIWLPIVLFVILGLKYAFGSFPNEKFLLLVLLAAIVVLLATAAVITFLEKPSQNNTIQQTIEDVRHYFESVNQSLALQGKSIKWVSPNEFMYLEVFSTMDCLPDRMALLMSDYSKENPKWDNNWAHYHYHYCGFWVLSILALLPSSSSQNSSITLLPPRSIPYYRPTLRGFLRVLKESRLQTGHSRSRSHSQEHSRQVTWRGSAHRVLSQSGLQSRQRRHMRCSLTGFLSEERQTSVSEGAG